MASPLTRIHQKKTQKTQNGQQVPWNVTALCEGAAIVLITMAAFLLLALLSFHPDDPSFNQTGSDTVHNLAGSLGAYLSDAMLQSVGYAVGWLVFLLAMVGVQLLRYGKARHKMLVNKTAQPTPVLLWDRIVAVVLLMALTAVLGPFFVNEGVPILPSGPGGILGMLGADTMHDLFGSFGSLFLLIPLIILALMVLTRFSLMGYWVRLQSWLQSRPKPIKVERDGQQEIKEQPPDVWKEDPSMEDEIDCIIEAKEQPVVRKGNFSMPYLLDRMTALIVLLWHMFTVLMRKIQRLFIPSSLSSPQWLEPMGKDPEPEFFPLKQEDFREPSLDDFSATLQPASLIFPEMDREPQWEDGSILKRAPSAASSAFLSSEPVLFAEPKVQQPVEQMVFSAPLSPQEEKGPEKPPIGAVFDSVLQPNPIFLWPESPKKATLFPPVEAPPQPVMAVKRESPFADPEPFSVSPEGDILADEDDFERSVPFSSPVGDPARGSLLPPFSLMVEPGPKLQGGSTREELNIIARTLELKLSDFKIKGQIVDVLPGPVVTTFELDLAPGLRAAKVIGLSDDLARSISAASVRVVGNVPGKTVIGIEIPNLVRQTVYLKEILSSEEFRRVGSPLAVALGSDIFGNPVAGNLAKMPHLLVAGTTGSGKSVAVNAMICSILFSARPDEVRFLMVDPKMLELSIYEGIPHLLAPVVTDVFKAANLLKWAVTEMENRYRLMSELGVRGLTGYNERILQCIENDEQPMRRVKIGFDPETGQAVEQEEPIPLETKPLIVIVIDELADLMIQVGKEVEPAIARLAQMARAAGLHLILATQRPSVDVITGLIKANFPTRLAFQVSSKIDSRTILDAMGADRLLGMGDGLFLPPGTSHLKRIHAPFVSDKEVHDLVRFLKTTGKPDYDQSVLMHTVGEADIGGDADFGGMAGGEEYDELYDQAVGVVIRARKVSTSMVQRHFKIGYNRAARIVERMELDGVVSEANGAGKREVLAPQAGEQ